MHTHLSLNNGRSFAPRSLRCCPLIRLPRIHLIRCLWPSHCPTLCQQLDEPLLPSESHPSLTCHYQVPDAQRINFESNRHLVARGRRGRRGRRRRRGRRGKYVLLRKRKWFTSGDILSTGQRGNLGFIFLCLFPGQRST